MAGEQPNVARSAEQAIVELEKQQKEQQQQPTGSGLRYMQRVHATAQGHVLYSCEEAGMLSPAHPSPPAARLLGRSISH